MTADYTLVKPYAIAAGGLIASYGLWKWIDHRRNPLPPGPRGWPVVGCMSVLSPDMYYKLETLGKTYGNIFSMYIGSKLTVVLNDYKALRAAFHDQSVTFAGRPYPWVMKLVCVEEKLNNGTYSEEYKEIKKLLLQAMRQFGGRSGGLDVKIDEEISTIMDTYSKLDKGTFDPRDHVQRAMANLIYSILINESYEYNSNALQEKLDITAEWQGTVGKANIIDIFPILRFFPFEPLEKLTQVAKRYKSVYSKHIQHHKDTFQDNHLRDVIDVFLKEKGLDYDSENLIGLFASVVGDSVDSLPEAIVWIMLYLAHYPHIQKTLQTSVDAVTRGARLDFIHRSELQEVEAFIMEGLRMSTFVPITEPHTTLEDTRLVGYYIPKDTNVLGNIYAAHMDKYYWGDPKNFRYERFLDENGSLIKHEAYMPFGIGRRACLGEQLASKVLFLFVGRLLQQFTLTFQPGDPGPDLEPAINYNRRAREFKVCALPR